MYPLGNCSGGHLPRAYFTCRVLGFVLFHEASEKCYWLIDSCTVIETPHYDFPESARSLASLNSAALRTFEGAAEEVDVEDEEKEKEEEEEGLFFEIVVAFFDSPVAVVFDVFFLCFTPELLPVFALAMEDTEALKTFVCLPPSNALYPTRLFLLN